MKNILIFLPTVIILLLTNNLICAQRISEPSSYYWNGYAEQIKFTNIGQPISSSKWIQSYKTFYIQTYAHETLETTKDEMAFIYLETIDNFEVSAIYYDSETVSDQGEGFLAVRKGLEAEDPCFIIGATPNNNRVFLKYRQVKGKAPTKITIPSSTNGSIFSPPNCYPRHLKIIREGRYLTAYHKDNVPGSQWIRVGNSVNMDLKEKAYVGMGGTTGTTGRSAFKPGIFLFNEFNYVPDPEPPYYINEIEKYQIERRFNSRKLSPGMVMDIDVTKLFGHYVGEYFTVESKAHPGHILDTYFWEEENYGEEEKFKKYIRIITKEYGTAVVRLSCVINGFHMETDICVKVTNQRPEERIAATSAPYGWQLVNLEIPVVQDIKWGKKFRNIRLNTSLYEQVYLGCWEYDWGGHGVGHYAAPGTEKIISPAVPRAVKYDFRNELYDYRQLKETRMYKYYSVYTTPYSIEYIRKESTFMDNWFADWFSTEKNKQTFEKTSLSMGFLIDNDTSKYLNSPTLFTPPPSSSIHPGASSWETDDTKDRPRRFWEKSSGFWTEKIAEAYSSSTRGIPFITNIQAGNWIAYTVEAPASGYYKIIPVAATTEYYASIKVEVNGYEQVKNLQLNKCANAWDWQKGDAATILLKQGENHIKIIFNSGDVNYVGSHILGHLVTSSPYSGIVYDTKDYLPPEEIIDMEAMSERNIERLDSVNKVLQQGNVSEQDMLIIDGIMRTFPRKNIFTNKNIIKHYKKKLDSIGIYVGQNRQDTIEALEVINQKLTNEINRAELVTMQQNPFTHMDQCSFLYKTGIDIKKKTEISVKIDSVTIMGKGTYTGIMIRPTDKNGELFPNTKMVAITAGSFEGAQMNFRWKDEIEYKKIDNPNIAQNVYLKMRINEKQQGCATIYYSYDNLYWWEYTKDPVKIDFLMEEGENMATGLCFTGGHMTNYMTLAHSYIRDFKIKQYKEDEDFENIAYEKEKVVLPLKMSITNVREGVPVDITFNMIKPGITSIRIFNLNGSLVETVMPEKFMPFSNDMVTVSYTFDNLGPEGIYMLRLDAPDNIQFIKFRFR